MKEKNSFLKKLKKIVFKVKRNKKLNLKKINFSEDFDSLEMLNFVDIIEKSFKIKIGPKELNYKNFSNLTNLQKMIEKKVKVV